MGLPKIFGRGGDEAMEGPGSEEVLLLSMRGSRAAPSVEWDTLLLAGAAGVAEGAPGALDVLAVEGAAGAAPAVSGLPPAQGGSVMPGVGEAPTVDGVSLDARFSSSPAARGGITGVAVNAGSGPDMV
jgi:hypothetical protein